MEELIKTASIAFASLATGVSFIISALNYGLLVKQKRLELYVAYRQKLRESADFRIIMSLLEEDDVKLRDEPSINRYQFLGFYEDISIMMKSGLINPHIVHYMFSYYALRCWESTNFWDKINKESMYWVEFRNFVNEMKIIEKRLERNSKKYGKKLKF